jgi:hypothetical protein
MTTTRLVSGGLVSKGDGNGAALWKDELILFYPEGPPHRGSEDASRFVGVKVVTHKEHFL